MKSGKVLAALLVVFSACGKTTPTTTAVSCPTANSSCASATGSNAIPTSSTPSIPLYIADSNTTGPWGYQNEPLVSVTICSPNHTSSSQCQTISNILLDTGSYGLRVFASAINDSGVQLAQQTISSQGQTLNVAECAVFGTGADWGPVENADVQLGNQTATNIPIQVINVNFASIPSACADLCPDTDPCTAGYNGILGVGTFAQDCGSNCDSTSDITNPGNYFACDGSSCYNGYSGNCSSDGGCAFQVPLNQQVVNPVASFASGYNNGVAVTLPSINASGASAITSGNVTLGVGSPTSVTVYLADPNGMADQNGSDFTTTYADTQYGYGAPNSTSSFVDSGSNAIFFPSTLTNCADNSGFYCPSSSQSLNATIAAYTGTPSGGAAFSIANADNLFNSSYSAFNNLGGPSSVMFDWGLPFFFGRTIYVGIAGTNATVNGSSATGPYWAF